MSGADLFRYLSEQSFEVIDSLYKEYNCAEYDSLREERFLAAMPTLIEYTSAEDIQNIFDFIDDYADSGGYNTLLLQTQIA